MNLSTDQSRMDPSDDEIRAMAERLAGAIAIPTISYGEDDYSLDATAELIDYMEHNFPLVHGADFIERARVNEYSLLYRVEGSERATNPYLLCAHLDVVPEGNADDWLHDPFSAGVLDGSVIYGRGAIDDKHSALGMLEVSFHGRTGLACPRRPLST